jgi:hypothetical protein
VAARNLFMRLGGTRQSEPLLWDAWGYMLHTPAQTPAWPVPVLRLNKLAGLDARAT